MENGRRKIEKQPYSPREKKGSMSDGGAGPIHTRFYLHLSKIQEKMETNIL